MPLIKENQTETPNNQNPSLNPAQAKKPSGLVSTLGSLLPLAPVIFEQWTGQKIPPLTGTLAEINSTLSSLQLSLSQVLQNQSQLWNRLEQLEKGANHQFIQLGQQFQSLRLTHTREKKEIEYSPKPESEY